MIEFQYFEGCPNASETLINLQQLLADKVINNSLKVTEIKGIDEAQGVNFQGSPSILVDGVDLYTGCIPESYNYTCRLYTIDHVQTGVLSMDNIMQMYEKLAK